MSCNRRSLETARAEINTCRVAAFCHAMREDYNILYSTRPVVLSFQHRTAE